MPADAVIRCASPMIWVSLSPTLRETKKRLNRVTCERGNGSVLPGGSADFQSAVSPNSIRQAARSFGGAGVFPGQRIGNPRYGRLETRATRIFAGQNWGITALMLI